MLLLPCFLWCQPQGAALLAGKLLHSFSTKSKRAPSERQQEASQLLPDKRSVLRAPQPGCVASAAWRRSSKSYAGFSKPWPAMRVNVQNLNWHSKITSAICLYQESSKVNGANRRGIQSESGKLCYSHCIVRRLTIPMKAMPISRTA